MEKVLYLDIEHCVGCGACVVACMDQNDIYPEKGGVAYKMIYQVEEGQYPDVKIHHFSIGCFHCGDSPCLIACPTGAILKDKNIGAVMVNKELCIGCHSCALACPFGFPRYDHEDKMQKCGLCAIRVENGLQPACVRVCPFGALKFEPINRVQEDKQFKYITGIVKNSHRDNLFNF
jgi:anaerobic dimethyl sulfoxide reductase subunit B